MKAMGTLAAVLAGAFAVAGNVSARGDILVRNDGTIAEGKVISRDAKGIAFLPEGADKKDVRQLDAASIARVIATDEHGGPPPVDATPATQPTTKPVPPSLVPPEPAPPPIAALPQGRATYYVIPLHGEVGATVLASALEKSLADALARKSTVVVLDIDSPGGLVEEAQQIIKVLHRYNKQMRIVALTDKDLSAAAIFSLAVKEIWVKSYSTIGAATAFQPSNLTLPPKIEEKMQSAWRAAARNSAEEGGHEPLLAEAMIDNDMELHLETANGKPVVKEGPGDRMLCRKVRSSRSAATRPSPAALQPERLTILTSWARRSSYRDGPSAKGWADCWQTICLSDRKFSNLKAPKFWQSSSRTCRRRKTRTLRRSSRASSQPAHERSVRWSRAGGLASVPLFPTRRAVSSPRSRAHIGRRGRWHV